MSAQPGRPADMLVGTTLSDGWVVESRITPIQGATGGHFSSSYVVTRGGDRAFLKALDYVAAFNSSDVARSLQDMTTAFNFERDLVQRCATKRMRNVVRVYGVGDVMVPDMGPLGKVSYIIFELAEGDIRRFRALAGEITVAWALRTVHQAALGLTQLHGQGFAHQDVKPSNLVTFDGGDTAKLADLGRASQRGITAPHDHMDVAGDAYYAPPEAFYGFTPSDWDERRRACDLYHLGSLLLFQLTGVNMTAALVTELADEHWPAHYPNGKWIGTYDDVLIYLREALSSVCQRLPDLPDPKLRDEIAGRLRELCDPDPRLRGHPKNHYARHSDNYGLERYVSHFNAMAARAERTMISTLIP